jgi:putative MATE family efflux protein
MQAENKKTEKFIQMTTAPVEKLVFSLALPSIAIMMISSIYNMADTYFVSFLGTSAIGAVGIAFPLMSIIQAIGFFFGQGAGNFISRALGAQDTEKAARMAATGFVSSFLTMALLAGCGLIFLEPLVRILGATPTIEPFAIEYIRFILIASPWMVAATVLNQLLRFQGSASLAMWGMMTGAILNIFLDPLFIFVLGLGIRGAAIATLVAQIVSFIILLILTNTRKDTISINIRLFSPSPSRYLEMFRGGVPALLRQGLMSITTIFINHFAGEYGDVAIAAVSIVSRVCMLAGFAMLGFGQGFQPVCGFNYGAKLYSRVKKAYWFSVRVSFSILLVLSIVMAIFAPQIIAFFRKDDAELILLGARGLRLHCISLPFTVFVIMCNMMTQTMGKAFYASIVAICRQGFFLLPALFFFSRFLDLGVLGIQLSIPVADILGFFLVIPITTIVMKGMGASPAEDPSSIPREKLNDR